MKYTDRSFRLKLYLGAVDQKCQLEPKTTEASSTPRPNATLSSESELPQHTDVPHTRDDNDRISNGQVSQRRRDRRVEAWRQFVMEWEPKLVGLLMHVLSYRFRDDIPTKLAAFERLMHESQSLEAVNDDTKIGVTVLGMEDMRVRAHPIGNSARIASWTQTREDILEITRTQHYTDSKPVPMQIGATEEQRQGQRQQGHERQKQGQGCKERVVQESESGRSEKVFLLSEDRSRKASIQNEKERPCRCRRETSDCKFSSERHSSGRATSFFTARRTRDDVSYGDAMCGEKTPCEDVNVETMMRPDASGTAPTGTECVKIISAIPTCETFLMWDKCAGGGICPRGSDQTAQKDTTATTMQLVTALDDPVH